MTDEYVQKYDSSVSTNITEISPKLKLLDDFDYDFEMQTVYFIADSSYLYSLNIITKDTKVRKNIPYKVFAFGIVLAFFRQLILVELLYIVWLI